MADSDIVSQRLGKVGRIFWTCVFGVGGYFLWNAVGSAVLPTEESCKRGEEYQESLRDSRYLMKKVGFRYTFDEGLMMQSGSVRSLFEIQQMGTEVHQSLQVLSVQKYIGEKVFVVDTNADGVLDFGRFEYSPFAAPMVFRSNGKGGFDYEHLSGMFTQNKAEQWRRDLQGRYHDFRIEHCLEEKIVGYR